MADGTTTVDQEQSFDPVQELRTRYPGVADEPDEKIVQHLSDPKNFRSAFPEYSHLDDATIHANMNRQSAKVTPPTAANTPGLTEKGRENIRAGISPMIPPTQFEKEHTPEPENVGTWGRIKQYGRALGNIGAGIAGTVADIGNPAAPAKMAANIGLEDVQRRQEGRSLPYRILAGGAGLAGVDPSGMERAAEHGDPTGVGIEAAAQATPVALGEARHIPGAPEAAGRLARLPVDVADKVARGTPITEAGKIEAAKSQAMTVKKPAMGELEYNQNVTDAMPDLIKVAQDNKGKITTPRQAAGAISSRVSQLEAPIADHLKTLTGPQDVVHQTEYLPAVGNAVMEAFQNHPGSYTPAEMQKAGEAVSKFIGDQPKTYSELEGNRKRLNQDADAYYHSDTAGKRSIDVSDATAVAQRAAANALRDVLYGDRAGTTPGVLERAGVSARDTAGNPVPIRELRQRVGKLLDVRDHFEDAITKAEATGDWKPFNPAFTGPSVAAGGIGAITGLAAGGPLGAIFGTLAGEGVKAWTDYLRSKNPNLNTTKMFRNLGAVTPQPTVEPVISPARQPAGSLPVPATVAGYNAGASGPVRGGRYTTPAGQIPGPNAGLLPGIGELAPRGVPAPLPGTAEVVHPEMFPRQPMGVEAPRQVYREPETGKMRRGYTSENPPRIVGQTAEGGPIREGMTPKPTLGNIASQAAPEAPRPTGLGTIGGKGREGTIYKPSEKAATMSAPRKIVPEQEALNFQEDIQRNKDILRNPKATAEDKRIAQSRLDEMNEVREGSKKNSEVNEPEKIPYTKPMPIAPTKLRPSRGVYEEAVHHHELGHAIVGALDGLEPGAIISHRFPSAGRATAAVLYDIGKFKQPDPLTRRLLGMFKKDIPPEKVQALTNLFAAGAAANEVIDGVPREKNQGLFGDKRIAKELFRSLGFQESQHDELWNAAVDRAKEKFTPEIIDIIKDEATRREDNLPVEYHYSENRVKHIIERVRSLHGTGNQTAINTEAATTGEAGRGSEEVVSGREGAGAQEPRVGTAPEKLKPFKPPQNTYTFKVQPLNGPEKTVTLQAIDRKGAFKKIGKEPYYSVEMTEEVRPKVGPPTQLEPIPFTEIRKNPLLKDAAAEEGRIKVADIGKMIGNYARKKVGKIGEDAAVENAIKVAAPEIKYQMATDNSGLGWYDKDTQKAVDAMQELHPELKDPKKASLFKTFWSALSYGKNPADNMMLAERAYQLYKDTGKMPITQPDGKAWGVYKAGHEGNMKTTQALIDKHGEAGAVDWLLSKHPTSELKEFNKNVAGKADEKQYGAVVYGPKGGNFYLNLNGVPDLVTVDKWMARTWRRWSGQLTDKNVDEAPSPAEIRGAREAVAKVADKLKLEPRDAQAVLWYYEQELYKAHGATSEALSYGNEARRIVDQRKAVQPTGNAEKGGGSQIFKKAAKY